MSLIERLAAVAMAAVVAGFTVPASAQSVTAYEGARLILGGGKVIDKETLVVSGAKIVEAGPEAASHKVDMIKIRVDTRDGKVKKMTPETYTAIIDEAHKRRISAVILRGAPVDRSRPVR